MKSKALWIMLISAALVFCVLSPIGAQGTTVTIDLKDLDDMTRNKVVDELRKQERNAQSLTSSLPKVEPGVAKEWVSVFTMAIKDLCHDLNVEVNEFIKTPVGMIIAGTIVYKVVGKDVLTSIRRTVLAVVGWFVSLAMMYLFVARKFFIRRRMKYTESWNDKERGLVKRDGYAFVSPYEFKTNDARTTAASFMAGFAMVLTIIALIVVLA